MLYEPNRRRRLHGVMKDAENPDALVAEGVFVGE